MQSGAEKQSCFSAPAGEDSVDSGQTDAESRPAAGGIVQGDGAAVQLHQPPGDGKPQPAAALAAGVAAHHKGLEDGPGPLGRDTFAVVRHREQDGLGPRFQRHGQQGAQTVVAQRVADQIVQRPAELEGVQRAAAGRLGNGHLQRKARQRDGVILPGQILPQILAQVQLPPLNWG